MGARVKQRTQLLFLTNNCRSNFCSQPTFPCRLSMWNDVWPGWHSFVNCAIIFLQIILSSGPICPFPLWPAIQALFCQIHTRTNYSKPSRLSLLPKRSNTPFVDGPENDMQKQLHLIFSDISHSTSQSTMLPKNLKPVKISSHIIINSRNKIRIR